MISPKNKSSHANLNCMVLTTDRVFLIMGNVDSKKVNIPSLGFSQPEKESRNVKIKKKQNCTILEYYN